MPLCRTGGAKVSVAPSTPLPGGGKAVRPLYPRDGGFIIFAMEVVKPKSKKQPHAFLWSAEHLALGAAPARPFSVSHPYEVAIIPADDLQRRLATLFAEAAITRAEVYPASVPPPPPSFGDPFESLQQQCHSSLVYSPQTLPSRQSFLTAPMVDDSGSSTSLPVVGDDRASSPYSPGPLAPVNTPNASARTDTTPDAMVRSDADTPNASARIDTTPYAMVRSEATPDAMARADATPDAAANDHGAAKLLHGGLKNEVAVAGGGVSRRRVEEEEAMGQTCPSLRHVNRHRRAAADASMARDRSRRRRRPATPPRKTQPASSMPPLTSVPVWACDKRRCTAAETAPRAPTLSCGASAPFFASTLHFLTRFRASVDRSIAAL